MGEDVGPGDVVERLDSRSWCWKPKDRAVVVAVVSGLNPCDSCEWSGKRGGLILDPNPLGHIEGAWCPNHWRKIGPSRSETVRLFAEDLNVERPKVGA